MARIPKCRCHLLRSVRRSPAWCCISCASTVIPLSQPGSPANTRRAARSSTWVKVASASNRWRTWLSTWSAAPLRAVRGRAHGQLPGGEGAHGQGNEQRKEGRQEVRGEEGETKVTR